MLFNEIYGSYFSTVSAILAEAVRGELSEHRLHAIVREKGFAESGLSIPAALKNGDWPLLSAIRHVPDMPLTTLEKRWMKAVLQDRRVKLFGLSEAGLEDVQPLFEPDTFDYYDRCTDGDPYDDPAYIACFRALLAAQQEKRQVQICFASQHGRECRWTCPIRRLEYSPKDDKFRAIVGGRHGGASVNLARITSVEPAGEDASGEMYTGYSDTAQLVFELRDERNALERAMMHFSHLQKETERIGSGLYRVTLYYDRKDETELLVRILGYGPVIRVIGPDEFIEKIQIRLKRQMDLLKHWQNRKIY